jgi:hypothetical protein
MAKTSKLGSELIAPKGAAIPATNGNNKAAMPRGTKDTVAVTVRLDPERYRRLVQHGAGHVPRRTNQEILVEALDAYLERE